MNFNLISPNDNGYTFNVRFDEPIVIPENASIHLNWATFERNNKFTFTENQTVKLNVNDVLPYFDYFNNGAGPAGGEWRINGRERHAGDFTITIAKGAYFLKEVQDIISQGFLRYASQSTGSRTGIDSDNIFVPSNNSLRLNSYVAVVPEDEPAPNYLEMGLINNFPIESMDLHPSHKTANIVRGPDAYFSSNASGSAFKASSSDASVLVPDEGSYNCYTMGAKRYIHTGGQFDQYVENGDGKVLNSTFDELEYVNTYILKTRQRYGSIKGNIFFGLYREGIAGVIDGTGTEHYTVSVGTLPLANRTRLANIKTLEEPGEGGFIPMCDFGIELCGTDAGDENKFVKIYQGNATLQSGTLDSIMLLESINLDNIRQKTDINPVMLGIQSYYDKGNLAGAAHKAKKGDLHIRVFYLSINGGKEIIFDTNSQAPTVDTIGDGPFVSKLFMREFNTEAVRAGGNNHAMARASIPFSPIIAFTDDGDEARIEYATWTESMTVGGDQKSLSNLNEYSITFSKELANLFSTTSVPLTTGEKNASLCSYSGCVKDMREVKHRTIESTKMANNPWWVRGNKLNPQFVEEKLAIYLPDLPIKSYKNSSDKSRSGFRKAILANIPTPFSGMIDYDGAAKVIGGYTASLGVVNRLSNQSMTTNNLTVEIRNLETDEPAELLTKSIVNFTISAE